MFGERARDRLAHCAMRSDELWIHVQHVDLGLISVTNVASKKNARRARHIRNPVRNQSASARFCGRQRLIAISEQLDNHFLQRFVNSRENQTSQSGSDNY